MNKKEVANCDCWDVSRFSVFQLAAKETERKGYTDLLTFTDVLIDGRFEIDKKSMDLRFRGSRNQRAIDVPASLAAGSVVLYPL